MIWSVSWKNVWRNKIRSLVVIIAFIFGIFGGVYTVAVFVGMMDQRIDVAIGNEASHIQLHNPGYLDNNELKYTINDSPELISVIENLPEVKAVCSRIKILGMASTSGNASGVMINGIDPEKEKNVTGIANSIAVGGGSFFNGSDQKSIVIGEKLAKTLKLVYYQITPEDLVRMSANKKYKSVIDQIGALVDIRHRTEKDFDLALQNQLGEEQAERYGYFIKLESIKYKLRKKIVLSFQALDGHLAYDAFRVVGIYKTTNTAFDVLNVYVNSNEISHIADLAEDQSNEIAVLLSSMKYDKTTAESIKKLVPSLSVQTWDEILPEAGLYSQSMNFYLMIFMIIILLALGFGIVNTMLMAVLERVKELGMLMAVGMNKKRVFFMIMLETVFLGLVGAAIGMLITYLLVWQTGKTGIDLRALYGEGFETIGFSAHIFPKLTPGSFYQITFLVILTGILASIYPARKALKLNPSEALRIDM